MSENASDRELVLGNKQLLAIFFVAALLCGVFFAVGYVVGGNSAKNASASVSDPGAGQPAEGKRDEPQANGSLAEAAVPVSGAGAAPTTGLETGALPGAEPRMADNPAASGPAPSTASTPAPTPVSAVQTAPVTRASLPASTPVTTTMALSLPEKGASYLQIAAQRRPAADDLAKSLRDRGWPTILAESSKPELVEVLVGPYRAPLAVADAKRKLTDLGFGGIIVHKQ